MKTSSMSLVEIRNRVSVDYMASALLGVITKGNDLGHLRGNKDMLGLCRLCIQINVITDLSWY